MLSEKQNQPGQLRFEEFAWTLFEYMAADQMFVYRASEIDAQLEPALALGTLSLDEKQFFWASQLDPASDPPVAQLFRQPKGIGVFEAQDRFGNSIGALLSVLRTKSWTIYPLMSREGLLGMVLVGWFAAGAEIEESRQKLARVITQAMALETDAARLYEQTHQQRQQSLIAQETTQAILRRDALTDTLKFIAREVMLSIDALGCGIWLTGEQGQYILMAQVGQQGLSQLDITSSAEKARVELLQSQKPFVYTSAEGAAGEIEPTQVLIAPLTSQKKIVGFLELTQVTAYHQSKDLVTVGAFADQAAVAVELDRLYQRLQQTTVVEERARLARDLHDSISQSIYAMTLYTRAARRQLEEGNLSAVDRHLSALHSTARESLGEMRLLIYELRSVALERYSLRTLLEQRLQTVEARSGLDVSLDLNLPDSIPQLVDENLYHIAVEALNNTIKHAQASHVWVSVRQERAADDRQRIVRLVVRDDGAGFDPADVGQGGVGLKSIRERVEMLKGWLAVETQPGAGVTISVEVPYGENSNSDR